MDNYVSFLFFLPFPRVPKLLLPRWLVLNAPTPTMSCFGFCQQCGFVRKDVQEHGTGGSSKKLEIDESKISECLVQLSQQRGSPHYVKQKTALECEFENFWSHLAIPKTLASALPEDVIAFLV